MRLLLAGFLLLAALAPASAVEPGAPDGLIDREDAVRFMVYRLASEKAEAKIPERLRARFEEMRDFYASRDGKPFWMEDGRFEEKRDAVARVFARADEFGMDPEDYVVPVSDAPDEQAPPEEIARAEIEMSSAVLQYALHARAGRFVPQDVSGFFDPSPEMPSAERVLGPIAEGADIEEHLESFHPQNLQFKTLRAELLKALGGRGSDGPVSIPASGPMLNPGDIHPDVALIRERLGAPSPENGDVEFYDEVLADAVRAFQEKNGLAPDAIVGPSTRRAFHVAPPPDKNILIANMERWRWFPDELGEPHVRVNIPEFTVRIVHGNRVTFEERIVVGKPENQTPIFSDEMETVVFNPFWNVPASITLKEILPIVRRNPGYIHRHNLEVFISGRRAPVDPYYVDWSNINPNKVFLRQPPGDDNALGNVKFLFPNRHSVYMHDTPTKHLFNQRVRAYSHGCMRVRNPRNFAEALLRDQGWSIKRINQTIASGRHDINVSLEPKIPVHIMYFTLWADENGRLQRFSDVYGHDQRVLSALRSARS